LFHERYVAAVEAAKRQSAFDFGVERYAHNLRRITGQGRFHGPRLGGTNEAAQVEGEVAVVRHAGAAPRPPAGFLSTRADGFTAYPSTGTRRRQVYLTAVKGPRGLERQDWSEVRAGRACGPRVVERNTRRRQPGSRSGSISCERFPITTSHGASI
jgi:hypothetical protein